MTNPDDVAQYEREAWSRTADVYLDTFAKLTGETIPILIEATQLSNGCDVLEIGSGPGHIAHALSQAGGRITGVDVSARMVDVAQHSYPDIHFQEADAERLPFDAESFHAVVCNFVVHHLARPEVVFKEIARVLRPGGRLAFVLWGPKEDHTSGGIFFAAVEEHHDPEELPHGPLFGVTELGIYEAMVAAGGLINFRLEPHRILWRSASIEPILRAMLDWSGLRALPIDVREKIEASTRENAEPYEQDGEYVLPHSVLLGTATKPT